MVRSDQNCAGRNLLVKYQPRRLAEKFDGLSANANLFIARGISNGTLPRVLLLTGPAGCGKGTTTRIIARRYCCQNKNSHPYDPCLSCDGCRSLSYGSSGVLHSEYGVVEFDATRMEGERLASCIEYEAGHPSVFTSDKTLICIDEIQRHRGGIQERLLRIIENTKNPILFATIDPGAVLPALRDRCVHLALRLPDRASIVSGLIRIASSERFALTPEAASLIACSRGNNPRRCVYMLELCMAIAEGEVITRSEVACALELNGEVIDCL